MCKTEPVFEEKVEDARARDSLHTWYNIYKRARLHTFDEGKWQPNTSARRKLIGEVSALPVHARVVFIAHGSRWINDPGIAKLGPQWVRRNMPNERMEDLEPNHNVKSETTVDGDNNSPSRLLFIRISEERYFLISGEG